MPDETNAPLAVDADAVLPFAVAVQGFEAVAGRRSQVAQHVRGIQLPKLAKRDSLDVLEAFDGLASMEPLGFFRPKGLDRGLIVYWVALHVNR